MAGKITWLAWVKLIEENETWARAQPRTLEREHVLAILADVRTNRAYYDAQPGRRQTPRGAVAMGTTLIEELEQAAASIADLCPYDMTCLEEVGPCDFHDRAARLRARAEHVRALVASVEELASKYGPDVVTPSQIIAGAYRVLTGDLPSHQDETACAEPKPCIVHSACRATAEMERLGRRAMTGAVPPFPAGEPLGPRDPLSVAAVEPCASDPRLP